MPEPFDPYYTWLGIPPEEQPPNHYCLLGIRPLEENLDAIEHAADRQMSQLRTFQSGKHSAESQKLLNEVSTAKITLLNLEKKAEYDRELRHQLKPKAGAKPSKELAAIQETPPELAPSIVVSAESPSSKTPAGDTASKAKQQMIVIAGGVLILIIGLFAVGMWLGGGDDPPVAANGTERPDAPKPPDHPKPPRDSKRPGPPPVPSTETKDPPAELSVQPKPPVSSHIEYPNEPIDLLAMLKLPQSIQTGRWLVRDGKLCQTDTDIKGAIGLGVRPLGNYELTCECVRDCESGNNRIAFPVGAGNAEVGTSRSRAWFEGIRGLGYRTKTSDPEAATLRLEKGQPHTISVRVEQADGRGRITAKLDGKPLIKWSGPLSDVTNVETLPIQLKTWKTSITYERIELAVLEGDVMCFGDQQPIAVSDASVVPSGITPPVPPPSEPETPVVQMPETPKHPIPSDEQQAKVLAQLQEIYDLNKGRTAEEKIELVDELLAVANDPSGDPAEQFAILRKAMDLAREAGKAELMLDAIDRIEALEFDFDVLKAKGIVLLQFAKEARSAAAMQSLTDSTIWLADDAAAAGRHNIAAGVLKASHAAAMRSGTAEQRKLLFGRLNEFKETQKQQAAAERARNTLQANPDDPDANLAIGRWLCFGMGDWEQGLTHLAKGSDAVLQQAAAQDSAIPTDPQLMAQVGDLWFDLAEKAPAGDKESMYTRAAYWYQKVAPLLGKEFTRIKVEKRLTEIAKIVPESIAIPDAAQPVKVATGEALSAGKWVDLMPLLPTSGTNSIRLKGRKGRRRLVESSWTRQDGRLIATQAKGQILLPVAVEGDYDLEVGFTATEDWYFIGLPVSKRVCLVGLNRDGASGLGRIDGMAVIHPENPTSRKHAWELGRKYSILSKVRSSGETVTIEILRDDQPLLNWSGNLDSLGMSDKDSKKDARPFLHLYKAGPVFHDLRARLVSGKGKLFNSAESSAVTE